MVTPNDGVTAFQRHRAGEHGLGRYRYGIVCEPDAHRGRQRWGGAGVIGTECCGVRAWPGDRSYA